jgi:N-acetylneuraminic acid mutarotase
MNRTSTPLLLALGLALLAGCSASSSAPGSASFSVFQPQALSSTVSRVSVTAVASDFPAVSMDLVLANDAWGGRLGQLPPGRNRAFVAQAFDAAGTLLFQGQAGGVSISAGKTVLVAITLQQVTAPPVFGNEAPVIDSLVFSSDSVAEGGELSLVATVHDPNPGDTLSPSWSSTEGTFSSSSSLATSWTAPASFGLRTITFSVTDSQGQTSARTLSVNVTPSPPRILSATRSSDTAAPGQELTFEVVASDPRNSALFFSWTSNTGVRGTPITSATTSRITWTAPATCVRDGEFPGVIVTVTNNFNQPATHPFEMTGLPVCPGWTTTGSMAAARSSHTATTLQDGKVLVAGGIYNSNSLKTVEVYDPASRTWSSTGAMSTPRSGHAATLLPGGKVLVTGGRGSGGEVSTAEVYDPSSGRWSATGVMSRSRSGHTATLLPDGKVLVTGGVYWSSSSALAEVYDPASGTWSPTNSMTTARAYHTATPLPGGKVLVVGGTYSGGFPPDTAEVYDPGTGTWSATGAVRSARQGHTAVPLPGGKVLVVGGFSGGNYLATAEVYDPASNTWSPTNSLTTSRVYHTATPLPGGRVLVVGGDSGSGVPPLTAEVYDPASNTWSAAGSMASQRLRHTATPLPNGRVLIVGGADRGGNFALATAEVYTPTP